MLKKSLVFIGALLLIFPVSSVKAIGEEAKQVRAIGVADGKSSKARDEALNDALRKAVEQGVGTFVTSELTVEQQRLVEERIYTETQGYIERYEVIRENTQDGVYEVEISALVKMGKLADDLSSIGLIIRKKQNPRVMVLIYSQEVDTSFVGVAAEGNLHVENQMEGGLMEKGFQLVDAGQVEYKKELESLLVSGDPARASKMAKDFGAEILVQGEVRRSFVEERQVFGRATRFFSNEVRVKALETDTARVLYSGFRTRPPSGAGAFAPLEDATSELIDEMVAGILDKWRKDVYQAGSYQLELAKVSFANLSLFKEGLKTIRGVGDVQVRNFQSGYALIELRYKGPLEELAEKISAMKKPRAVVTGFQSNTLEISIKN